MTDEAYIEKMLNIIARLEDDMSSTRDELDKIGDVLIIEVLKELLYQLLKRGIPLKSDEKKLIDELERKTRCIGGMN